MDATPTAERRITGPADLLQAVPYLLGFVPDESLVLIGLDAGSLVVTARLDLTDAVDAVTLAHTVQAMANGGVTSIIAVAYADTATTLSAPTVARWWSPLADAVRAHADTYGCDLLDVLLVAGDRWRSVWCREPGCCPPEGQLLPSEPSVFAAAATVAGVVALPDRRALEAVLDPLPDTERADVADSIGDAENDAVRAILDGRTASHERSVKRALFAAARLSHAPRWLGCSSADVARFAVALTGAAVRDAIWLALDDGRLDGRPLWADLARRAPAPYDAAPAFLFGWAAWRAGDGAAAGIAATRALDSDPGYSAADLLLAALSHGLDPRTFPRLRKRPA